MIRPHRLLILLCAALSLLTGPQPARAQTPDPDAVVRAILFYSPTCGHCEYVITQTLPPLFEKYGDQLQMAGVDVTREDGQVLFQAAVGMFNLEKSSVPFLVIGDRYLVGSKDIPEQFPGLIDQYLAQGGVDWPAIPGFLELITAAQETQAAQSSPTPTTSPIPQGTPTPAESTSTPEPAPSPTPGSLILTGEGQPSLKERLGRDPLGNGLAIIVLIGMLGCVGYGAWYLLQRTEHRLADAPAWVIPLLCCIGLAAAGYLAYVETTHTEAVCGPVGDCNAVQQSRYARLFGVLPIGLLGLVNYVALLAAWAARRYLRGRLADTAALAMLVLAAFGTLFSIYLTFLEPFVIGATCAWCLTSAAVMTGLFLSSLAPGKRAYAALFKENVQKGGIDRSSR